MTKRSNAAPGTGALGFETALGTCVLAWTPRGVRELHLPEPGEALRRAAPAKAAGRPASTAEGGPASSHRLVSHPASAPAWVRALVARIRRHLLGGLESFEDVALDLPEDASAFDRAIWEAARLVPPGLTITYGELAEEAGHPGAARACGSAMARCPVGLLIPAHRVIAAGRRPGGWTGAGGVSTKLRLLEIEGVRLDRRPRAV